MLLPSEDEPFRRREEIPFVNRMNETASGMYDISRGRRRYADNKSGTFGNMLKET